MAEHNQLPSPPELRKLEALGQRLASWEVFVDNAGSEGSLNQQELPILHYHLALMRQRFEHARMRWLPLDQKISPFDDGIGLPPLPLCHREELLLVYQYLEARYRLTLLLEERSAEVQQAIDEGLERRQSGWRIKWRVSRLRKDLDELEAEKRSFDLHRNNAAHAWDLMSKCLMAFHDLSYDQVSTRMVFERLIDLCHRVSTLQAELSGLDKKTKAMSAWLDKAEASLSPGSQAHGPLAEDIRIFTMRIDFMGLEDLSRSRARLALARKYVESYLAQNDQGEAL